MNELKVLFVGVGSIARRHILNLAALCRERNIELSLDAVRSGQGQPLPENVAALVGTVYHSGAEVPSRYDAAFITNPTACHLQALRDYGGKAEHFFIEKPLIDSRQLSEWQEQPPRLEGIAYVACPLRYTGVIRYLKQHLAPEKVHAVRAVSSSYLPDWRPGQDYRETYSAHKELGGGVSIDLIHEWDYLCYLFGAPDRVQSFIGQVSRLELDSDDLAVYLGRYPDKIVELHLDYFGRVTRRQVEIYAEDDTIIGDLVAGEVRYLREGRTVELHEARDAYQKRELEYFLDLLAGSGQEYNNPEMAIKTLKLAMGEAVQHEDFIYDLRSGRLQGH